MGSDYNEYGDGINDGRPVVVVVGAGSKHGSFRDKLPSNEDQESTSPSTSKVEDDRESNKPTASIESVRWGLGGALSVLFAKRGYDVVLMGRRMEILDDIRAMVENEVRCLRGDNTESDPRVVFGVECDVTDDGSVQTAFETVRRRTASFGGYIDLVIFNVAPPYPPNFRFEGWGDVLLPHQIDLENMAMQQDTQVHGLVRVSRSVLPGMIDRKRGCVLVSGESCCNLHGRYEFGSVAPARAALRSLAQCMFQSYAPMGIHVCTINIGGIIDSPKTRTWSSMKNRLVNPNHVAEEFWNAYRQRPTVWSYEIQLTQTVSERKVDMRM